MKSLKILSIIGLVIAGFSWWCLAYNNTPQDYEGAIAWGYIAVFYLIALAIVSLIQANRNIK